MNLYNIARKYENIENFLLEKEGEYTEEILNDLNVTEARKDEAMKEIYYNYLQTEDDINLLKARIKDLQEKLKAKEVHYDSLKKLMEFALKIFGDTRVDEFTLGLRPSKYVDTQELEEEIANQIETSVEEQAILDIASHKLDLPMNDLLKVVVEITPKKGSIGSAIKEGLVVPGCVQKQRLNLKVK